VSYLAHKDIGLQLQINCWIGNNDDKQSQIESRVIKQQISIRSPQLWEGITNRKAEEGRIALCEGDIPPFHLQKIRKPEDISFGINRFSKQDRTSTAYSTKAYSNPVVYLTVRMW
jgi:hypothetical protein